MRQILKTSRKTLPITFPISNKNEHTTIGSWITIPHPSVAEIMAMAGFDWLVIDTEHSPIGISEAEELIRVIQLCGIPGLVRVDENNPNSIKRVMDSGASGVIVPMVNTKDQAVQAVKAVKYPPLGHRGVGLGRAQGYGTMFKEYQHWVAKESTVIIQIEHIQAVNNIEAILSVDGVDGFIVGPYDLSSSLGIPGQFDHPSMLEALKKIKTVINKEIKPSGFHVVEPDVDVVFTKLKEGYSFIAFGVDFFFISEMIRGKLKIIRENINIASGNKDIER